MNREDLKRYLGITGYSLGQVEKDYFQHIVLSAISRKMNALLVFKGGTALQKTGIIPRFSEDLDFTAMAKVPLKIVDVTEKAIEAYNYPCDIDHIIEDERNTSFRIKIEGPLYRNGMGISTIKIEISKREAVLLPPEPVVLSPVYPDVLPYPVKIMNLEEIAAEKIRAIYTRNRARDLYDLYKLLEIGINIDTNLVNKKLEYYDKKFEYGVFLEKAKQSSVKWEKELSGLLEYFPPKDTVLSKIYAAFRHTI